MRKMMAAGLLAAAVGGTGCSSGPTYKNTVEAGVSASAVKVAVLLLEDKTSAGTTFVGEKDTAGDVVKDFTMLHRPAFKPEVVTGWMVEDLKTSGLFGWARLVSVPSEAQKEDVLVKLSFSRLNCANFIGNGAPAALWMGSRCKIEFSASAVRTKDNTEVLKREFSGEVKAGEFSVEKKGAEFVKVKYREFNKALHVALKDG